MSAPPRTFHDLVSLRGPERLLYHAAVKFFEVTGLWRYPIAAEGDIERMALLDMIYWAYKAQHPIARARRRSGLEAFFARQAIHEWELPPELCVEHELTAWPSAASTPSSVITPTSCSPSSTTARAAIRSASSPSTTRSET